MLMHSVSCFRCDAFDKLIMRKECRKLVPFLLLSKETVTRAQIPRNKDKRNESRRRHVQERSRQAEA